MDVSKNKKMSEIKMKVNEFTKKAIYYDKFKVFLVSNVVSKAGKEKMEMYFRNPEIDLQKIVERNENVGMLRLSGLCYRIQEKMPSRVSFTGRIKGKYKRNVMLKLKMYLEDVKTFVQDEVAVQMSEKMDLINICMKDYEVLKDIWSDLEDVMVLRVDKQLKESMERCLEMSKEIKNLPELKKVQLVTRGSQPLIQLSRSASVNSKYILVDAIKGYKFYTTPRLMELGEAKRIAEEEFNMREEELLKSIYDRLISNQTLSGHLESVIDALSTLDVLSTFAVISIDKDLRVPTRKRSASVVVMKGIQSLCFISPDPIVLNDLTISEGQVYAVVGDNAEGKTTFLWSIAIVIWFHQIGCHIPCSSASLPIYDKLYFLSGRADCIFDGKSSFVQHISDLKEILENCTLGRCLILLDEPFSSTSATEGASLLNEYCQKLISRNPLVTIIFTTHFEDIGADTALLYFSKYSCTQNFSI